VIEPGALRGRLGLPERLDDVAVGIAALDAHVVRLVPVLDELDTVVIAPWRLGVE
jgi:hypothetical protein